MTATRLTPQGLAFWHPAHLLATWFGVGLMPYAPGTWGSVAAIPFAYAIALAFGPFALLAAGGLLFFAGWWAAERYCRASGQKDPRQVVIDEVVGQWIVLAAAPLAPAHYFAAFVLFRVFDIAKPWPANRIDRELEGGLGVMLDDVVAGLYGLVALVAAQAVVGAL